MIEEMKERRRTRELKRKRERENQEHVYNERLKAARHLDKQNPKDIAWILRFIDPVEFERRPANWKVIYDNQLDIDIVGGMPILYDTEMWHQVIREMITLSQYHGSQSTSFTFSFESERTPDLWYGSRPRYVCLS